MHVDNAAIVAILRARGLHARADWVDRQLPALVDIEQNASLLQTLGIDPADIAQSQPPPETVSTGAPPSA